MEPVERTYLIRKFERYCKQYYIQVGLVGSTESKIRPRDFCIAEEGYFTIRDIIFDLKVLTEKQIEEHENHMREQYKNI